MKIFILFLIASLVQAGTHWPKEIDYHLQKYRIAFKDTYVSSVWGTCNAPKEHEEVQPGFSFNVAMKSEFYTDDKLMTRFNLHPDFDQKKRDIVIVIPGAFSNLNEQSAGRLGRGIYSLGHNTIQFANPWGLDVIDNGPKYKPGDFETEAYALYQAIKKALVFIKGFNIQIDKIRVIGISYGAFVSSILSYLDASADVPFLKDFTLISPPYQMGDSLAKLDGVMDEMSEYYKYFAILGYPMTALQLCNATSDAYVTEWMTEIAKYLSVYSGFHGNLAAVLRGYDLNSGLDIVPDRTLGFFSPKYREWKRNLRFTNYLEEHAPEILEKLRSEKGYITHWIQRTLDLDDKRIRILTSNDDFINAPDVWPENDPSIIVLRRGGHFGFRGLKWFDELLEISFNNSYVYEK